MHKAARWQFHTPIFTASNPPHTAASLAYISVEGRNTLLRVGGRSVVLGSPTDDNVVSWRVRRFLPPVASACLRRHLLPPPLIRAEQDLERR